MALKDGTDKVEEELHSIIFMYKMGRSRYGKLILDWLGGLLVIIIAVSVQ